MATRPIDEFPYRFELVPVDRLFVDKKYQRKVSDQFIKRMVADWRPHLVGTLAISGRDTTTTGNLKRGAIVDGQSRWTAGKQLKLKAIPCCVYEDLSTEEEALLFVDIQTRRRGVAGGEKFRAKLAGKIPEAVELNNLVEAMGFRIGNRNETENTIAAVAALESCFRRDASVLERELICIGEAAWRGERIPASWHIRGLWRFLKENPGIDDDKLISRMKIAGPDSIYKRALNARQAGGMGSQAEPYMAQAFKAVYSITEAKLARVA